MAEKEESSWLGWGFGILKDIKDTLITESVGFGKAVVKKSRKKIEQAFRVGYTADHNLIDEHIVAFKKHFDELETWASRPSSDSNTLATEHAKCSNMVSFAKERLNKAEEVWRKISTTEAGVKELSDKESYLCERRTSLDKYRSSLEETERKLLHLRIFNEYTKQLTDFDDKIVQVESRIGRSKNTGKKLKRHGSIDTLLEDAKSCLQAANMAVNDMPDRGDGNPLKTNLQSKEHKLKDVQRQRKDQRSRICTVL